MPYLAAHGTMKPPNGAQIDPAHPFAQGHLCSVLFNEGAGTPQVTGAVVTPLIGSGFSWTGNREGRCWFMGAISGYLQLSTASQDLLGTAAATICVIRRKVDTTARAAATFGFSSGAATYAATAHLPYSDGVVYWDFGGNASAHRLTVSGLTFTAAPERWVFTAGPQGSAIWRDGIKLASQATAIARTVSLDPFNINRGPTSGDEQELNFFMSVAAQWSDDRCRWWSAEPYAHLYGPPYSYPRRAASLAAAAGGSGTAAPASLGLLGVG